MMDVLSLRRDSDFQTKTNILDQLQSQGVIDQLRAQLRSQVIKAMEQEKKKSYGGASKYLQQSELSNPVTKKVVTHPDGLLCAEIIREFLNFYKMNLSLQVFVPEMSLGTGFPKTRSEIEREVGIEGGDNSKPLLLRLLEQIKYGDPVTVKKANMENANSWTTSFDDVKFQQQQFDDPFKKPQQMFDDAPPATSAEKETKEKKKKQGTKKGKKKDKSKSKEKEKEKDAKPSNAAQEKGSSLTKLDDLPSLGGPKKQAAPAIKDDYDFGFDDDDDYGNKQEEKLVPTYKQAQKYLEEHDEEENKGYKINVNKGGYNNNNKNNVNNDYEDDIEEEIQSEYDNNHWGKEGKLGESSGAGSARGLGITVSQSLGIDKSVDSLALDEYDHIEFIDA